jgi:hypothetical protein
VTNHGVKIKDLMFCHGDSHGNSAGVITATSDNDAAQFRVEEEIPGKLPIPTVEPPF